jgi:hypothetical protein
MSGSAKAGTIAERYKCELRILAGLPVRAPPKRASGELCFFLTKTYMEVGKPHLIRLSTGQLLCCSSSERNFIGPTVAYAYMQAVGMVNDHLVDCFRYREILREIANAN